MKTATTPRLLPLLLLPVLLILGVSAGGVPSTTHTPPNPVSSHSVSGSRADNKPNSSPPSTPISVPSIFSSKYQEGEEREAGRSRQSGHEIMRVDEGRTGEHEDDGDDDDDDDGETTTGKARARGQLAAARLPQPEALQGGRSPLSTGQRTSLGPHVSLQGIHLGRIPPSCALCSTERNLCRIISGIFTRSPLPYGYSKITPVPAGVCNLTITEMKPSKNFFALRRSDGTYVLNGNWDIQAAGRYQAGGTTFLYTPGGEGHGEQLSAPGPLTEPIDFMLISQSPNPGIKYEYRVPLPEYLSGNQPGLGLQPSTGGLGPPTGGVRPNIGSLGSPGSGLGRGPVRPSTGHFTPFQPIPQGNTNIATRNPNFSLRNPSPRGVSTGGSGLYPNLDGGSFAPLTPVLQPVGRPGQAGAFNSSVPFSGVSPQAGVGTNLSGPSRRNPTYTRLPLVPASGQGSRGSLGLSRVPPYTPPATSLANPGSPPLNLPWNPTYNSQDRSHIRGPLGTPFLPGQQYPRVPGVATSPAGTGFQDSIYASQSRTGGERPSASIPGHRHHPQARPSTPSTPTISHRTRHHHGSKGAQGQRKVNEKAPEFTNFDPGVQLTQPKTSPSAPSGNRTNPAGAPRRRGSKGSRRRHRHQQDGGTEGGKRRRKGKGQRRGRSRFQWAEKGLTPCSKPCGGGNQTAILSCERKRNKKVVPDRRCSHLQRPESRVVLCNLTPCPATWMPGEWGSCSVTCGMGVQTRRLVCKQVVSPTLTMMVPEGACLSPPSVPTSQVCEIGSCNLGPVWETGPWTNCSAPCGLGTRGRQVSCMVAGVIVSEGRCQATARPTGEEVCDMGSCVTHVWFVSRWSDQCSEACGAGVQTRRVHCLGGDDLHSCPASSRPDATRPCLGEMGCGGQWFTGVWSECSQECGGGQEMRAVLCGVLSRGRWRVMQDSKCQAQDRPQDSRDCNLQPCTPQWFTSDWSQCSASCEGGVMRREVTCLDASLRPSPDCLNTTRPDNRQPCHLHSCSTLPTQPPPPTLAPALLSREQTEEAGVAESPDGSSARTENRDRDRDTDEFETSKDLATEEEEREDKEEEEKKEEEGDDMEPENELVVEETTGSALNVIPDKDAQGDESISSSEDEGRNEDQEREEEEEEEKKKKKKKKDRQKGRERQSSCIDRIKNCHLVFRARLCRLRYYNKLCCRTCSNT